MLDKRLFAGIAMSALAVSFSGTGCATKKHVAARIAPVEARVSASEGKLTEQGKAIDTLETDLSKTKERVIDLDSNLKKTSEMAQDAGNRATQANAAAGDAKQSATDARSYAENRGTQLQKYVDNLEYLKMAKTTAVNFGTNRATLDDAAKATLDEMARDTQARKKFVLEIQGYTDSTGSPDMNLNLSQRRAEAVVRYLNINHKIPLRSIHLMGVGEAEFVADNKTRDGRRQNRRVEVRLFAPETEGSASAPSAQLR